MYDTDTHCDICNDHRCHYGKGYVGWHRLKLFTEESNSDVIREFVICPRCNNTPLAMLLAKKPPIPCQTGKPWKNADEAVKALKEMAEYDKIVQAKSTLDVSEWKNPISAQVKWGTTPEVTCKVYVSSPGDITCPRCSGEGCSPHGMANGGCNGSGMIAGPVNPPPEVKPPEVGIPVVDRGLPSQKNTYPEIICDHTDDEFSPRPILDPEYGFIPMPSLNYAGTEDMIARLKEMVELNKRVAASSSQMSLNDLDVLAGDDEDSEARRQRLKEQWKNPITGDIKSDMPANQPQSEPPPVTRDYIEGCTPTPSVDDVQPVVPPDHTDEIPVGNPAPNWFDLVEPIPSVLPANDNTAEEFVKYCKLRDEIKSRLHPGFDHNGECLICDCFPSSCKCGPKEIEEYRTLRIQPSKFSLDQIDKKLNTQVEEIKEFAAKVDAAEIDPNKIVVDVGFEHRHDGYARTEQPKGVPVPAITWAMTEDHQLILVGQKVVFRDANNLEHSGVVEGYEIGPQSYQIMYCWIRSNNRLFLVALDRVKKAEVEILHDKIVPVGQRVLFKNKDFQQTGKVNGHELVDGVHHYTIMSFGCTWLLPADRVRAIGDPGIEIKSATANFDVQEALKEKDFIAINEDPKTEEAKVETAPAPKFKVGDKVVARAWGFPEHKGIVAGVFHNDLRTSYRITLSPTKNIFALESELTLDEEKVEPTEPTVPEVLSDKIAISSDQPAEEQEKESFMPLDKAIAPKFTYRYEVGDKVVIECLDDSNARKGIVIAHIVGGSAPTYMVRTGDSIHSYYYRLESELKPDEEEVQPIPTEPVVQEVSDKIPAEEQEKGSSKKKYKIGDKVVIDYTYDGIGLKGVIVALNAGGAHTVRVGLNDIVSRHYYRLESEIKLDRHKYKPSQKIIANGNGFDYVKGVILNIVYYNDDIMPPLYRVKLDGGYDGNLYEDNILIEENVIEEYPTPRFRLGQKVIVNSSMIAGPVEGTVVDLVRPAGPTSDPLYAVEIPGPIPFVNHLTTQRDGMVRFSAYETSLTAKKEEKEAAPVEAPIVHKFKGGDKVVISCTSKVDSCKGTVAAIVYGYKLPTYRIRVGKNAFDGDVYIGEEDIRLDRHKYKPGQKVIINGVKGIILNVVHNTDETKPPIYKIAPEGCNHGQMISEDAIHTEEDSLFQPGQKVIVTCSIIRKPLEATIVSLHRSRSILDKEPVYVVEAVHLPTNMVYWMKGDLFQFFAYEKELKLRMSINAAFKPGQPVVHKGDKGKIGAIIHDTQPAVPALYTLDIDGETEPRFAYEDDIELPEST